VLVDDLSTDSKNHNQFGFPQTIFQKQQQTDKFKKLFNYNALLKTHNQYEIERIEKYQR